LTLIKNRVTIPTMDSDFRALSEKIASLADLTAQLRRENADLRLRVATLATENADMSQKLLLTKQKVTGLLDRYPEQVRNEEWS
jgi:predicted  nucleic acid-binding Zn-ribbon protein